MYYFIRTGNPFVDNGIYALLAWSKKSRIEDLTVEDVWRLLDVLPQFIQNESWRKFFYNIFPNRGGISSPKQQDISYWKTTIENLMEKLEPLGDQGSCIACGKRDIDNNGEYFRNFVPLTGTGEMLNFFPSAKMGVDLCPSCILTITFGMLSFAALQKIPIFFQSSSHELNLAWANWVMSHVSKQLSGNLIGPLGNLNDNQLDNWSRTYNIIFFICNEIADRTDPLTLRNSLPTIQFYHFTNYNQLPLNPLAILDFPIEIFQLLYFAKRNYPEEWRQLVQRGYRLKKKESLWNLNTYNSVYEKLLKGQSILRHFLNLKKRNVTVPWEFLHFYLRMVIKMNEERIQLVTRMIDDMAAQIKFGQKKWLFQLETSKSWGSFLNVLIKFARNQSNTNIDHPFLNEDEFVSELFPEQHDWLMIRDLMLFGLYSRLHDWLQCQDLPDLLEGNDEEAM